MNHRSTSLPIGGDPLPVGARAVFEWRTPAVGDQYAIAGGIVTATHPHRRPTWILTGLIDIELEHDNSAVIDDKYRNASVDGHGPGDAHLRDGE